ncbi:hypothetical protein BTH42_32205 [Burkholderia sp. SRS-W-2-2016]|uniref:autotransporter outer membrane beta-barrel domain-containing protein n=1 Tax=Burkholderia sp. SRS-W-2-2016 TaxID=1926878 RepID=UPI00094ADED2|nr:autotransporter outer membrane beta-barrel domain-containing protein [Burkholderia sp. SRS-W-2-2016]OLL27507.1 hypothetical protein BTH42_32205 [Burkholderia sp. SRS-W-2-2016]
MLAALQPSERALAAPPCYAISGGGLVAEEIDGCGGYGGGVQTTGSNPTASTGGESNPAGAGANGQAGAGSNGGGGGGSGTTGGSGGGTNAGGGGTQAGQAGGSATGAGAGGGGGAHGAVTATDVSNATSISGGAGGAGASGSAAAGGGGGGAGGYGVVVSSPNVAVTNNGNASIAGGSGGTGGGSGTGTAGEGGDGGHAVEFVTGGGTLVNSGAISGGRGGNSGASGLATSFPEGGNGGVGVRFLNGGAMLTNSGSIAGGDGGNNSQANATNSLGGNAGAGVSGANIPITNTGTIRGGNGGNGGTGGIGQGANGGAGIVDSGSTGTIINSGTIQGGNGGAGRTALGASGNGGGAGGVGISASGLSIFNNAGGSVIGGGGGASTAAGAAAGAGGAGISGADLTIFDSGTITGGSAGGVQANAITFSGGTNYLELRPGFVINGNAVVQAGSGTLALGGSGNSTFDASRIGAQYLGFGQFLKTGAGTWQLTAQPPAGPPTPWTIQQGTLAISSNLALGVNNEVLTFNNPGSLNPPPTLRFDAAGIDLSRGVMLATAGTFDTAGNAATISGQIAGAGGLIKTGDGTLTPIGTNTYSGGTTIQQGTLAISTDGNLGATSGGFTFNSNNQGTAPALQFLADVVTSAGRTVTLATTGTVDTQGNAATLSGPVTGGGALVKAGTGTLTLSGANTYTGGTLLNAGTLTVGNNSALGTNTLAMANGTTLSFASADNFVVGNNISLTGTGNVTPPSGTQQTLSGTISDGTSAAGRLAMQGPGTLVLTGGDTYTGGTTISAGTLQLGNGGTSGSIVGDVTDNSVLSFNRNNDLQVDGTISGTGSVAQIGTGRTILTAANTYTGGTTISAGTLQLGNGGASGSIAGDVTDNGVLAFDRSNDLQFDGTISGTGSVAQTGSGRSILTAVNPYTGGTTVSHGTLVVGDPAHTGAALSGGGPIEVAPGATLGGYGTVTGNVTNDGTVSAGNATPGFSTAAIGTFTVNGNLLNEASVNLASDPIVGNVLHVTGNYAGGTAATVTMNTLINPGGPLANQLTDRLLVEGNTSGTTLVTVKPLAESPGGTTSPTGVIDASEGISIVQVAGNSTQQAFALPGGYVVAPSSPHEYRLYAYGPGSSHGPADAAQALVGNGGNHWDYRLQSAYVTPEGPVDPEPPALNGGQVDPEVVIPSEARPEVVPQVAAYVTAPAALLYAGMIDMDSLHRRLGEIRDDQALDRDGGPGEMFIRAYGGNFNYSTNIAFKNFGYDASGDYSAIQFGANALRYRTEGGLWRFGLAGSVGWLHFEPQAVDGPSSSRSDVYRLSGYGTYQSRQGWYVDSIVSVGWFNGTVNTSSRGEAMKLEGNDYAASLEAGYPFALPYHLNIEPQLQLVGQHLSFHNAVDADGLPVNIGSQNQVTGRLGVRVTRPVDVVSGRVTPYLGVDVLHAFADGTVVQVGDEGFTSGKMGDAVQFSIGVNGTTSPKLSLYGRVSYQQSFGSAGFRGWLVNAGARYLF